MKQVIVVLIVAYLIIGICIMLSNVNIKCKILGVFFVYTYLIAMLFWLSKGNEKRKEVK